MKKQKITTEENVPEYVMILQIVSSIRDVESRQNTFIEMMEKYDLSREEKRRITRRIIRMEDTKNKLMKSLDILTSKDKK
jgi:hypothetical protein